jgi:hypothetical protein
MLRAWLAPGRPGATATLVSSARLRGGGHSRPALLLARAVHIGARTRTHTHTRRQRMLTRTHTQTHTSILLTPQPTDSTSSFTSSTNTHTHGHSTRFFSLTQTQPSALSLSLSPTHTHTHTTPRFFSQSAEDTATQQKLRDQFEEKEKDKQVSPRAAKAGQYSGSQTQLWDWQSEEHEVSDSVV